MFIWKDNIIILATPLLSSYREETKKPTEKFVKIFFEVLSKKNIKFLPSQLKLFFKKKNTVFTILSQYEEDFNEYRQHAEFFLHRIYWQEYVGYTGCLNCLNM